jgi:hypothetical protein
MSHSSPFRLGPVRFHFRSDEKETMTHRPLPESIYPIEPPWHRATLSTHRRWESFYFVATGGRGTP